MEVEQYAKSGLNKLTEGFPEISLEAKTVGDLMYISTFFEKMGYAVESGTINDKREKGFYPITIFQKQGVEANSNA